MGFFVSTAWVHLGIMDSTNKSYCSEKEKYIAFSENPTLCSLPPDSVRRRKQASSLGWAVRNHPSAFCISLPYSFPTSPRATARRAPGGRAASCKGERPFSPSAVGCLVGWKLCPDDTTAEKNPPGEFGRDVKLGCRCHGKTEQAQPTQTHWGREQPSCSCSLQNIYMGWGLFQGAQLLTGAALAGLSGVLQTLLPFSNP